MCWHDEETYVRVEATFEFFNFAGDMDDISSLGVGEKDNVQSQRLNLMNHGIRELGDLGGME